MAWFWVALDKWLVNSWTGGATVGSPVFPRRIVEPQQVDGVIQWRKHFRKLL